MSVQALQAAGARGACDPARQLGPEPPLLLVRSFEAVTQRRICLDGLRPTLDAAGRLQSRDRCDEMWAGDVEGRREGRAGRIARPLLGNRRPALGTADGYAPEGSRRATELLRDNGFILHAA